MSTTHERVDGVVDAGLNPLRAIQRRLPALRCRCRSGGVARNDFGAQTIPSAAPLGGVRRSGMGAYHGKAGFDAFSHYRTVVGTDLAFSITRRRERGVAHGAQPNAQPAQEPLIACSLAHR